VPVLDLHDGISGEGIIKDLSLSGSYMNGNAPVSVGMALTLQLFVPGNPNPVVIDRFNLVIPKMAERITAVISTSVKTQHGSFRKD
jgi:hypothetical protein